MRWAAVVLVFLVLVGVWVLAYFLPELRWFAEALTAVVLLVAVLLLAVPVVVDRRKRAAAARAAKDKADEPNTGVAPELAALRSGVRKAIATLERVRGGRNRARVLPCYLWVAAQGPADEATLQAWGLARVALHGTADAGRPDPGSGPFACDLWCSKEAIAVAPAGFEASERDAWPVLLDELRRARPNSPVDGVLVCASVSQLLTESDLAGSAARVRARIEAMVDRLGLVVPVYLILTGADAIPGFVDFWADLPNPDDSAWGASFAIDDDRTRRAAAAAVRTELDVLAGALHARLFDRLAREADPERRARALGFPLAFRKLTTPVTQFLEELCRPGAASEHFLFRGFYFVSGAPSQAVGPSVSATRGAASRSYFLTDVLRSVILPDRHLAAPVAATHGLKTRRDAITSLVVVAASFLILAPALFSYVHNIDLAETVEAVGRSLGSAGSSTPGTKGDSVELGLDTLKRCRDEAKGWGIPGWFSPRSARELQSKVREAYVTRLHAWMTGSVRHEVERRLDAVAAARGLPDSPTSPDSETPLRDAYDVVRLYASLADPAAHGSGEWVARGLADVWRSLLKDGDAVSAERLREHASEYVASLSENPQRKWATGHSLIAARERLRKLDVRGIPYRRLLLAARDAPPLRATAIFSAASLEFLASRGDVQIPGAFTVAGWAKIRDALRGPLGSSSLVERWVLDDVALPADDDSFRQQMLQTYYDEYTRRWMSFLDEIKVQTPPDMRSASAELTAFKEGDGFYKSLFSAFKENAIHEDDSAGPADAGGLLARLPWFKTEVDAAARPIAPSPVEKGFRPILAFGGDAPAEGTKGPAPLEKYLAILEKLKAALEAPPAPKPGGQDPQLPFTEASTGVAALLDGIEEPTRGRLWRLLMPPVMGGALAAKAEGASALSADWRSAVWTAWDKLRSRYPFTRSGHAEPANFADFAAFFRPDGTLWGFVHAHLGDAVEANGEGKYVPKPSADPLAPDLLTCLTVAQEITDAFFSPGEDPGLKLSIQADWTASDVAGAKWWVGSKEAALPRAQWAGPIRWFGEDVRVEWQQGGRPTQELGRHAFSLFDLFDHLGGLKASASGRPTYTSECPPLTLKLRPEGKVDALRPDFFQRLHCPQDVRVSSR